MRWWMPAAIVGALSAIIVAIVAVQEARIESISLEERLRAQLSSAATHDPATVADLAELHKDIFVVASRRSFVDCRLF